MYQSSWVLSLNMRTLCLLHMLTENNFVRIWCHIFGDEALFSSYLCCLLFTGICLLHLEDKTNAPSIYHLTLYKQSQWISEMKEISISKSNQTFDQPYLWNEDFFWSETLFDWQKIKVSLDRYTTYFTYWWLRLY